MTTTVLITGANRGIGLGLLKRYLLLSDHTIIAGVRDPAHPTAKALSELPSAAGSKLIVVKMVAGVWQSPFDAVKELQGQGIDLLDVVIANAGIANVFPLVREVTEDELDKHMRTNAYSIPALFQAVRPLLQKSTKQPVFAIMGTTAGSLTNILPFPNAAYGPSKGASAWYSIHINAEEEWLNSFSFNPGFVRTDMGNLGADTFGMDQEARDKMMVGVDESCDGMMKVLAETSREKHGGKLVMYSGETMDF